MNLKKIENCDFYMQIEKDLYENMGTSTEYVLLGIASFKSYQPNYAQKLEWFETVNGRRMWA